MSNSVVPAAAVAHAKQLVRNKNLTKQTGNQQHAPDEQNAVDHSTVNDHHQFDATNVVQIDQPDHVDASHLSMAMPLGDVAMGDSVFADALAGAAVSEAALTTAYAAGSAQDDGGSASDDGGAGGPGGTVLLVGAVGLAGLGVAVAAGGGGHNDNDGGNGGNENQAPTITSGATASVDENADLSTVVYDANATDPDGDTLTYSLGGADKDLFNINSSTGEVTLKAAHDVDAATDFHFTVTASDGSLSDSQDVTLTINPVAGTEISLDDPGSAGRDATVIDASNGAYVFTDDASVDTNVIIHGFGDDDIINVVGAASGDYSFGTNPDDASDVQITYQDQTSGALNVIVIDDVLPDDAGVFFTEAGAETQVGHNFINFA